MRILLAGRNAKIGGGTTYLQNLLPALQQRGCPKVDSQLLADQVWAACQQLTEPDDWIESVLDQHFNPSRIAEDLENLFAEAIHNK